MTTEQILSIVIRSGAAIVWLLYLIHVFRSPDAPGRFRAVIILSVLVSYAGIQAYRAWVAPTGLLVEFTALSAVALMVGLAVLTTPRR